MVPEPRRQQVQEILERVFPPASWAFGGSRYGADYTETWFREHRACHSDLFDKYFYMAIPEGDLPQEEVDRIVSLAGNREGLVSALNSLNENNLLNVMVKRLENYKETIDLVHAITFITALFDVGDNLPTGQVGLTEIPPDMHAARIVYWYLKREPDLQRRFEILKECIEETTGIYLPAFVVALEGDKAREGKEEHARLADDAGLQDLQKLCASRIRQRATAGTLVNHPRLGELLGFWQAWSSLEEVKEWVSKLAESPEGAMAFLVACTRESRSYGLESYTYQSSWQTDLAAVERFVAPELLESRLTNVNLERLEAKQKQAVTAFRKALKRKRDGKPVRMAPFGDD